MAEANEVARLQAEISLLRSQLQVYEKHHANCNIGVHMPRNVGQISRTLSLQQDHHGSHSTKTSQGEPKKPQREPKSLQGERTSGLVPFDASSTQRSRRNDMTESAGSGGVKRNKNEEAARSGGAKRNKKDEAARQLLDEIRASQHLKLESHQINVNIDPRNEPTAYKRAKSLADATLQTILNADHADKTARSHLFCFFSFIVVQEDLKRITREESNNLLDVIITVDASDEYRSRLKSGTRWMHSMLIMGLCKKGWPLDEATAIVAVFAPNRAYKYAGMKGDELADRFIAAYEEARNWPYVEALKKWCIPSKICCWDTDLTFDRVCDVLYPEYLADRLSGLLKALCHASDCIQLSLLHFVGRTRRRWASNGALEGFTAEDIGLDPGIASVLRDTGKLQSKLKKLESKNWVQQLDEKVKVLDGPLTYCNTWEQATIFVCFLFSGCEYSAEFSTIGNAALPLFERLLERYLLQDREQRHVIKAVVAQALLQASKFSDLHWKKRCITVLEDEGLEDVDAYTKAYFVVRKAFVLRSDGKWDESSDIIRGCLSAMGTALQGEERLNALRGLLVSSLASNLWERERFHEAALQWNCWRPLRFVSQDISLYETRVLVRILVSTGIASLHQGCFEDAKKSLESAQKQYDPRSRPLLDVIASLSDVFCELGQPSEALKVLESIIKTHDCLSNKYLRNCYIAYAEASVCLGNSEEAEATLSALKEHYERDLILERHDRRRYFRTLVLLAQNVHRQAQCQTQWKETKRRWMTVITIAQTFDELSKWDFGMICFSMHHALLSLGESSEWFERGAAELMEHGHFWMRGMTTYWQKFLMDRLPPLGRVFFKR